MKLSEAQALAEQAIYDYTSSTKWQEVKYMNWTTAEMQDVIAKALVKNIKVIPCCKSDSEQLQAFKKDDIVLLDNKVKVRVIIPEPKVLIDEEESGCKMWVETKRLVKQK